MRGKGEIAFVLSPAEYSVYCCLTLISCYYILNGYNARHPLLTPLFTIQSRGNSHMFINRQNTQIINLSIIKMSVKLGYTLCSFKFQGHERVLHFFF